MEKGEDPYVILGVSQKAEVSQIKKAYYKLALSKHPDRQSNDEDRQRCQHEFAKLSAAYEILSDEEQRRAYDRKQERKAQRGYDSSDEEDEAQEQARTHSTAGRAKRSSTTTSDARSGRKRQSTAGEWASPLAAANDDKNETYYHMVGNKKFHDPYQVFKAVFREEFGEEYVPGKRPQAASAPIKMMKQALVLTGSKKKQNMLVVKNDKKKKNENEEVDNRPLAMKMKSKQILHPDGSKETITTTTITRPDGTEERITKSDRDKDYAPKGGGKKKSSVKAITAAGEVPRKKKSASMKALTNGEDTKTEERGGFVSKLFGKKKQ